MSFIVDFCVTCSPTLGEYLTKIPFFFFFAHYFWFDRTKLLSIPDRKTDDTHNTYVLFTSYILNVISGQQNKFTVIEDLPNELFFQIFYLNSVDGVLAF